MRCTCVVKKSVESGGGSYEVYGDGAHWLGKRLANAIGGAADSRETIEMLEDALTKLGFSAEWIYNDGTTETTRWVES